MRYIWAGPAAPCLAQERENMVPAIYNTVGPSDATHPHSSIGEKLNPNCIQLVQLKRLICIYIAIQISPL